jgi:hypothetical protein
MTKFGKPCLRTLIATAMLLLVGVAVIPNAAADSDQCTNSGVQVVVGDYNCSAQYCDNTPGAGAGAGAGTGAGPAGATAGATAGNDCQQGTDPKPKENCGAGLAAIGIRWDVSRVDELRQEVSALTCTQG